MHDLTIVDRLPLSISPKGLLYRFLSFWDIMSRNVQSTARLTLLEHILTVPGSLNLSNSV